jgi:hypothetical protein
MSLRPCCSTPPSVGVVTRLLRSGLGDDRVLTEGDVELLATTAWTRLHPAA